ncbi:hypothetical protein E2C01_058245 [Portunus trituberculatus]|uniref:Uncharacterized protein n=1 Tax=Portunus trituberculatus TaxID=210409 RepID=A0A5B7H239_PORTR|nr:hypothetical protein [Portunus trituberculatus]
MTRFHIHSGYDLVTPTHPSTPQNTPAHPRTPQHTLTRLTRPKLILSTEGGANGSETLCSLTTTVFKGHRDDERDFQERFSS